VTSPDITERIPSVLSARALVNSVYSNSGIKYDFALAGLPFFIAPSPETPYRRRSVEIRRQQIDTSREPGEQSLSQWWVRDQDSWHRGAGIKFYDPGSDPLTQYRFEDSRGVDVWTKGDATLLYRTEQKVTTTEASNVWTTAAHDGTSDVLFNQIAGTVTRWTTAVQTNYSNATGLTPATKVAVAGSKILVGTTGGILSGDVTGSALTSLWTGGASVTRPFWVKSRIIATKNANLYEMTLAGGAIPAPLYTHPTAGWQWTAVTETPDSIMVAGHAGGYSAIYEFLLTDTGVAGGTPTLSDAVQVAEFPPGERVTSLSVYLGGTVAIGTNLGIRVGRLGTNGRLEYGPLLVETTTPVVDVTARDRFLFCLTQNPEAEASVIRVDLSQEIENLVFAYAWDASVHALKTGNAVALYGEKVAIAALASGIWVQESNYESTGYIRSGRVRYATTEPKYFGAAKVRSLIPSTPAGAGVSLSTIDPPGNTVFIFRMEATFNTDEDIGVGEPTLQHMQLLLTLDNSTDLLATPTLQGWQLKALPVPPSQRRVEVPILMFDVESDPRGTKVGIPGSAWARLQALEDLESAGAVFTAQDMTTGEQFRCKIEAIDFVRTSPPDGAETGFGGRVQIALTRL
jgi:hypothetical protein